MGKQRSERLPPYTDVQNTETGLDLTGRQITVSEGNPWPPVKGDNSDIGGPFYTTRTYCEGKPPYVRLEKSTAHWKYIYQGHLFPHPTISSGSNPPDFFPPDLSSTDSQLEQLGATAVARCKPTNSVADLSTALGELVKEGLPSLPGLQTWRDRSRRALDNSAAGEYLNYQFGWQPMISEINNIAKAITHSESILRQYERDAGKLVRRRYELPSVETSPKITKYPWKTSAFAPANFGIFGDPSGAFTELVLEEKTSKKQWFSGAFTYHLPTGYHSRNALAELAGKAEILLGIAPTPETIWNLTPWSWAADWFSNTGDVISNVSDWATNGLIMHHGYMMETTITKYTYSLSNSGLDPKFGQTVPPLVLVRETKKRVPANPFGFGVKWESLSDFQTSILVALGISRGR